MPLILTMFVLSMLQSGLTFPIPLVIRHIFDTLIPQNKLQDLMLTGALLAGLYATSSILYLFNKSLGLKVAGRAAGKIRLELLQAVSDKSLAPSSSQTVEDLHFTMVHDTERIRASTMDVLTNLLPSTLIMVGVSCVLLKISLTLTLLLAIVVPLSSLFSRKFHAKVVAASNDSHRQITRLADSVHYALTEQDLIQTQSAEAIEAARQQDRVREAGRAAGARDWHQSAFIQFHHGLLLLMGVMVLVVGGFIVAKGKITVGELLSFSVAVALLNNAARIVLTVSPNLVQAVQAVKRVHGFLFNAPAGAVEKDRGIPLQQAFKGNIRLQDLSFHHPNKPWVLENINLTIPAGKIVALCGPNGAGKSTLINLVLGLLEPQKGELLAEAVPYKEISLQALRKEIAVVRQHPRFLPATIRENLSYGNQMTETELEKRLHEAGLEDLLASLPKPNTYLGLDARMLSGGQKQKLAIARALLRSPKLLILDEPTNHLDGTSVQALLQTFKQHHESLTILLATHNTSFLSFADTVYELRDGQLRECEKQPSV